MANYIYGIDIGGTTVKMGLFDEEGTMIDKWEIVTHKEDGGEQILPDIAASIKEKNEEKNIATEDILGIGMGLSVNQITRCSSRMSIHIALSIYLKAK